jgi:hypothetical protein
VGVVVVAVAAATRKAMPAFFIIFFLTLSPSFQKSEASTSHAGSKKSTEAMVVPVCSEHDSHLRRIAWGKFGPQFDVPMQEVEVLGGEPDVDYVRYVIKPKTGDGHLELWFGPMAMSPDPEKELLENSVDTQKRKIVTAKRKQIGTDSSGKLRTGEVWRHVFLTINGMEGAEYKASTKNSLLFDRIIDSICYVPSAG